MGVTTGLALLAVAATGLQAYGQYREAEEKAKAENYNAAVSRQESEIALEKGASEAARQRRSAGLLRGRQESIYAKSGVLLRGSPLTIIEDSAAEAELDAMIYEYNAKIDSSRALSEAAFRESQAKAIRQQGLFKAGTTILTGAVDLFSTVGTGTKGTVGSTGKTQSQILGYSTARYR